MRTYQVELKPFIVKAPNAHTAKVLVEIALDEINIRYAYNAFYGGQALDDKTPILAIQNIYESPSWR